MSDPAPQADQPPRKLARETRRQQLIEATIETLATRGYARTTMTEVATQAGVAHGLVNFHFQSKEKLLSETLSYMSDEYRENWTAALDAAAPDPAARLDALIRADFNPAICTPTRLAAWFAFWGEAQSRPLYQAQCGANDETYLRQIEAICAELIRSGGYSIDAPRAARVLRVVIEGLWLDMIAMTAPYARAEALATVHCAAAAFFPRHFGPDGLVAARA